MLRGMTGFGRIVQATSHGRFTISIRSLNRKHLDIRVVLPHPLTVLEIDVRNWIAARLGRGHVTAVIEWQQDAEHQLKIHPNLTLLRQLRTTGNQIAQELALEPNRCFELVVRAQERLLPVFTQEVDAEQEVGQALHGLVQQALDQLLVMRAVEGKAIATDLSDQCDQIDQALATVQQRAPQVVEHQRKKLQERLKEFQELDDVEGRLAREIALVAERVDIAEEMQRLAFHTTQLRTSLEAEKAVSGKTLEFRLQEMGREANTMGAKANDKEIAEQVILIKSAIDRMREQVQNVE